MLRVTQISESAFTVKGHGVHTAFTELSDALRGRDDVELTVNRRVSADITHIHTVGLFALFFLLFGSGKKVVSAHIVPESLRGSLVGANWWLPLATRYLRWFYNRADLVIAVSDATQREVAQLGVSSPVEVVYNLIDTDKYRTSADDRRNARASLGLGDDDWLVVGNGQVQPRKRIDSFIRVARELPDMTFLWVGGMPFKRLAADTAAMQRLIDTAPANVTVTGVIDHAEVRRYYQAADVFWLPSQQETFGLAVIEAASAGLPVMLRDIPDYAETFAGHALLENEEGFAATLKKLRTDTAFYKTAVTQSAILADTYGIEQGLKPMLEAYQRLIRK